MADVSLSSELSYSLFKGKAGDMSESQAGTSVASYPVEGKSRGK